MTNTIQGLLQALDRDLARVKSEAGSYRLSKDGLLNLVAYLRVAEELCRQVSVGEVGDEMETKSRLQEFHDTLSNLSSLQAAALREAHTISRAVFAAAEDASWLVIRPEMHERNPYKQPHHTVFEQAVKTTLKQ